MADREKIVALRQEGMSYRAIGAIVGVSHERVRQILEEEQVADYASAYRRKLEERARQIIALHKTGMTQKAIAAHLGMKTHTVVGQVLRDAGLSRYEEARKRAGIDDQVIATLKAEGLSPQEIAARIGVKSVSLVQRALKRMDSCRS